jgi:hypothetical protein
MVQDGRQARGQAEVNNPEVGQWYRTAGRLRDRQSGQAGGYKVRAGKGKEAGMTKREAGKRQKQTGRTLVNLRNKTNW